jgi:hypothetical protein
MFVRTTNAAKINAPKNSPLIWEKLGLISMEFVERKVGKNKPYKT